MELRRYRTTTEDEGLFLARTELGPSAVVLSSRKVNRLPWLPWLGGREVEVTAAIESQVSADRPSVPETDTRLADPGITELAARLRAGGVEPELALEIASAIPARRRRGMGYAGLVKALSERFESLVATDQQHKPIEVFVGPPGAGKTTTVAKVAARARALQGMRVGLVAADGYRVGAVEQLRIYASIIGCSFTAATTVGELERALRARSEPVLVDTAGRSPHDPVARELFARLTNRSDVRMHLVLDAGQSVGQLSRVIDIYRDLRPDRIVVTKVDQIEWMGPLLGLLGDVQIPVSYVGSGQRVPEDLDPGSARFLAESVLGERPGGTVDAA